MMEKQLIEKKLHQLPEHLKKEVLDFIDSLIAKSHKKSHNNIAEKKEFNFEWEGGLSDLKAKYTSIELQHRSMDWR